MPPIQFNPGTSEITVTGAPLALWNNTRRSLCLDSTMSWLLPRAVFLRALGIIGIIAFLSWGTYAMGLIGPNGIWPLDEYLGMSAGLDFETKIMVKLEAAKLLRRELSSPRYQPVVLSMSGVTDCYQPVEKKLQITR